VALFSAEFQPDRTKHLRYIYFAIPEIIAWDRIAAAPSVGATAKLPLTWQPELASPEVRRRHFVLAHFSSAKKAFQCAEICPTGHRPVLTSMSRI
jgi:hypothetical protein